MIPDSFAPDIAAVRQGYVSGQFTPRALMEYLTARSARYDAHNIWIYQLTMAELEPYLQRFKRRLSSCGGAWAGEFLTGHRHRRLGSCAGDAEQYLWPEAVERIAEYVGRGAGLPDSGLSQRVYAVRI